MRLVLITGGTRGIGAAIALKLYHKGYKVIVNYHKNHDQAEIFKKSHKIPVYAWDVGDEKACAEALLTITKTHGPIEILVHNAGITHDGFFHKMTSETWQKVINTNLNSCFYMIRPVIESMRTQNFGRIICLSSVNAQKGQIGQTNYCAAKAGIIGFVKALALENAIKGITVNAITPGYSSTDMVQAISPPILEKIIQQIPLQRLATPEEVADLLAFLVADATQYITGAVLPINGGLYLS